MYKRILVASDASEGGLQAVAAAADLCLKYSATLIALHVYEMPAIQSEMIGGGMINGIEALDPRMLDDWMNELNETVRKKTEAVLTAAGVRCINRQEIGRPANTIVRIASEEGVDLIVLGSRGLSGIEAFLLGSVSERVAHLAHCSVLIVR